jgi:hypothetical protein
MASGEAAKNRHLASGGYKIDGVPRGAGGFWLLQASRL